MAEYATLRDKIRAEKAERLERYANFEALWVKAHEAGKAADAACVPTPMIVGSPSTPLGNDVDLTKKHWFVPGGACGFGWVTVRPANCSFAKWAVKTGKCRAGRNYNGGLTVLWCPVHDQSVARQEAYCRAFARVLKDGGVNAYADSRLD